MGRILAGADDKVGVLRRGNVSNTQRDASGVQVQGIWDWAGE